MSNTYPVKFLIPRMLGEWQPRLYEKSSIISHVGRDWIAHKVCFPADVPSVSEGWQEILLGTSDVKYIFYVYPFQKPDDEEDVAIV